VLTNVLQDTRDVIRGLRRRPGFAVAMIATLATSIGFNAAVFTVVKAALFDGLPLVENSSAVVHVTTNKAAVYYPDFEAWRAESKTFEDLALTRGTFMTFDTTGLAPKTLFATEVTANAFGLLGTRPMLGRDFLPADQQRGAEPVVLLRHDLWVSEFGGNPGIVGGKIRLNGVPTTVIGVMPEGFSFPEEQRLWTPLVPTAAALNRETYYARYAVGRLSAGATLESARAELATISRRLASEYPQTNRDLAPVITPFNTWLLGSGGPALYWLLLGAVTLVLLIGCANAANLLLGRAIGRLRDTAIRYALGAGVRRIVRQLVIECLLVSILGGALGWWLARAALRVYVSTQADTQVTRVLIFTMDATVIAYVLAISVGAGLLASLGAAARLTKLDVNVAVKGHGAAGDGHSTQRASSFLVGAQMALALALLANAGVMIHSFLNLSTADIGVKLESVLTASLYVPPETYPTATAQIEFYGLLHANLQALPQVEAVGFAQVAPTERVNRSTYGLANSSIVGDYSGPTVAQIAVTPGYFEAVGSTLLAGRDFNDFDRPQTEPVVIVNERFAEQTWPGRGAVGERLRVFQNGEPDDWRTVVGVVSDIVQNDATRQAFEPLIYVPHRQRPSPNMFMFARARGDQAQLMSAISREVYRLDPNLPVPALMPLAERLQRASAFDRNFTGLLLVFGAFALSLAATGLYAAVSRTVINRTREIGIRVAIGASRAHLWRFIFDLAKWPLACGLGLGIVGALALGQIAQTALVGVSPADPLAFASAACALVLAAVLGCVLPARRAMRIDATNALKHD